MNPAPISNALETIATAVVDSALIVHRRLGPGLLESIYETCLAHELRKRGLTVKSQIFLTVEYDTIRVENAFKIDLLVEDCFVVEVKAVEALLPVHRAQLLTYLKLSGHRLGLLLNFNVPLMKDGIVRVAN